MGFIVEALRAGVTYEAAAAAGGITYETFNEWRKQHAEFSEAVKAAEADAERRLLGVITAAAPEHWQAAAWILERRLPERYGRPATRQTLELQHSGEIKHRVQIRYTDDWRSVGRATPTATPTAADDSASDDSPAQGEGEGAE